jgi:hypothetical protein
VQCEAPARTESGRENAQQTRGLEGRKELLGVKKPQGLQTVQLGGDRKGNRKA